MTTQVNRAEELRGKAAKLLAEAREIKDAADNDNRRLTGEESEKVNRMLSQMDEHIADAELEERMAGIEPKIAPEERGRRLPEATEELEDDEDDPEARALMARDEYRDAFSRYVRRGEEGLTGRDLSLLREARALSEGVDSDGGYLAPEQLLAGIRRDVAEREQLAPRMNTINTNARAIRMVLEDDIISFGWVAELQKKPEDQPSFDRTQIDTHTAAVIVKISDELLEDETFGLESYISVLAAEAKIEIEETAFMTGNGSGKPWGILTRLNGETGAPNRYTTAVTGTVGGDDFVRALYALKPRYRRNATWVLGTNAILAARLLKDGNDHYIWQPGLQAGEPASILGRPVVEAISDTVNRPVAAGNDVGVVGDLRRYTVLRRLNMQVKRLTELYAETDEIGLRFRFRTGADINKTEAFRSIRVKS